MKFITKHCKLLKRQRDEVCRLSEVCFAFLLRRFAHLLAKKDISSPEVKKDLLRRVKSAISSTAERFSGYMQNVREMTSLFAAVNSREARFNHVSLFRMPMSFWVSVWISWRRTWRRSIKAGRMSRPSGRSLRAHAWPMRWIPHGSTPAPSRSTWSLRCSTPLLVRGEFTGAQGEMRCHCQSVLTLILV